MRKVLWILVCLAFVAVFAMAGGQGEATRAKTFELKYNQLEAPSHPQGITQAAFAQKIEELSGGQIKVRVFASGSLFTQQGTVTAMMNGDLDLSTLAFQDMGPFLPAASMFAAPYIFTSYQHFERVFAPNSPIAADFYQRVAATCGYTPLAAMTQGSRTVNTKWTRPIRTPEDMRGMNLRMPNAPDWINAGKSLGANVTPIAYAETYTALQTGVVDAQDNPLPGIFAMKFYEVARQISLTRHIIDVKLLCVTNKVWTQMNPQQQQWMRDAAQFAAQQGNKATYEQEAKLIDTLKGLGVTFVEPDVDAFQRHSLKFYQDNGLTRNWDMDLYARVQALK